MPVTTVVDPLDRDTLVRILTEPKNALTKQYQQMFKLDGVELVFTDEALSRRRGSRASERDTGARGLRSIVEKALLDMTFRDPVLQAPDQAGDRRCRSYQRHGSAHDRDGRQPAGHLAG